MATTAYNVDTTGGGIPDQTRYGAQLTIQGFPTKCNVIGLAAFLNTSPGESTFVEWFADSGFTNRVGFKMIAAGETAGRLVPVVMNDSSKWQLTTAGAVYVRVTKPATGQATVGALVISIFPYMGT